MAAKMEREWNESNINNVILSPITITRVTSILRHMNFQAAPWNLPFATQFAACRAIASFFATFISNSRFFGLLFNFTIK